MDVTFLKRRSFCSFRAASGPGQFGPAVTISINSVLFFDKRANQFGAV